MFSFRAHQLTLTNLLISSNSVILKKYASYPITGRVRKINKKEFFIMNKIKRKIIGGAVIFGCAVIGLSAAAKISQKAKSDAVPVSMLSQENEIPVIVLDAGHGEST